MIIEAYDYFNKRKLTLNIIGEEETLEQDKIYEARETGIMEKDNPYRKFKVINLKNKYELVEIEILKKPIFTGYFKDE